MKMMITGVSGFIGNHLLRFARATYGTDVTAFSSRSVDGCHIIYRDAPAFGLDSAALAMVKETEVLIHAGAFTPKCGADANQIAGCNGNITFTDKLLALPWSNLKKIIFLSTVDVYGNVDSPISETTLTVPTSLYALSKLYGERMVSLYAGEKAILSHVLRIGHVYGPGEEKYEKVLPKAIKNIIAGKDVELWGDGKELRSFIYIDDVVKAILKTVTLHENLGVINIVSGNTMTIRELLETLINIGGSSNNIVHRECLDRARNFIFDNTKLKQYLLPEETDFTTGLQNEFRHSKNLSAKSP